MKNHASFFHFITYLLFLDVSILWYVVMNCIATLPAKDGNYLRHKRAK